MNTPGLQNQKSILPDCFLPFYILMQFLMIYATNVGDSLVVAVKLHRNYVLMIFHNFDLRSIYPNSLNRYKLAVQLTHSLNASPSCTDIPIDYRGREVLSSLAFAALPRDSSAHTSNVNRDKRLADSDLCSRNKAQSRVRPHRPIRECGGCRTRVYCVRPLAGECASRESIDR